MSQANPTDIEADTYARLWMNNGGDQADAWRGTFTNSECKAETVHSNASRFHKISKVRTRIADLQAIAREIADRVYGKDATWIQAQVIEAMEGGLVKRLDGRIDADGEHTNPAVTISGAAELNRMQGNHAATRMKLGGDENGVPVRVAISRAEFKAARGEMLDNDDC